LSKEVFIELRNKLVEHDLISTPEDNTIQKRYRRFINKLNNKVSAHKKEITNDLELLLNKNLLLLDLGFAYLNESLLKQTLILSD